MSQSAPMLPNPFEQKLATSDPEAHQQAIADFNHDQAFEAAKQRLKENKYMEWGRAGGPNECKHGYAEGIPCRQCDEALVGPPKWSIPTTPDFTTPIELPYATEGLAPEQVEVLTVWENTKAQLAKLKEYEMQLRKAIVIDGGFFDKDKTAGTEHFALPGGYDLVSVKKENYSLKNDNNETDEALEHFSDDMAAMLVKWTPTLSVSNFKKLTKEEQAHFDKALEIKTGAPTLEIKEPKKPR